MSLVVELKGLSVVGTEWAVIPRGQINLHLAELLEV